MEELLNMNNQKQKLPVSEELTDKQKRLLIILAETPCVTEAAKQAGISRSTAKRWMNNPTFQQELDILRKDAMKTAMNSVHAYTAKAIQGLIQLMDSSNEWVQMQACMKILNRSLKIRKVEDLEERVALLEKELERKKSN